MSKEERYKWITVDQPGSFHMLNKHALKVDHTYQRESSEKKILEIAAEWSWAGFGTCSVALRQDGEWYVIDGQHRVLAALKRGDITMLPCMVFELDTIAEEARAFLKSNTNRKPVTMVQKFKALITKKDHAAVVANDLVIMSGRTVQAGSSARAFTAAHALHTCVEEDEAAMRRVWPVIVELCQPDLRISGQLINGMFYLERHLGPGVSLSSTHWRRRIVQVGVQAIEDSITNTANLYGGGKGYRNCAMGLIHAINKGLRNHLPHTVKIDQ